VTSTTSAAAAAAPPGAAVSSAVLAPATRAAFEHSESAPCSEAIGDLPLQGGSVEAVEIWGGDAQVRLAGDTVFLTETSAGWRITAAVCRAQAEDEPYECEVDGP
jgi:hypothetical protein